MKDYLAYVLLLVGSWYAEIDAFQVQISPCPPFSGGSTHQAAVRSTKLFFRNETTTPWESWKVSTSIMKPDGFLAQRKREQLKHELAIAAIEDYDMEAYNSGMTSVAEDLMKELEHVRPWNGPAYHPKMNARWSFVFTGVPTIGMRLITLLSRLSVGFSDLLLEFDDVFLEVANRQSQVKAVVAFRVLGQPLELNVVTRLRPNVTNMELCPGEHGDPNQLGTYLVESFDKLILMGVEIPTPTNWKKSRDLQITYLDEDMMIARTAGGEPHLLLRHSPCSTDDDSCSVESELSPFFQHAMTKYGSRLSRSLVDRAFSDDAEETYKGLDVGNILQLVNGILFSPNH